MSRAMAPVLLALAWSSWLYSTTGCPASPPLALIDLTHTRKPGCADLKTAPASPLNEPSWPRTTGVPSASATAVVPPLGPAPGTAARPLAPGTGAPPAPVAPEVAVAPVLPPGTKVPPGPAPVDPPATPL